MPVFGPVNGAFIGGGIHAGAWGRQRRATPLGGRSPWQGGRFLMPGCARGHKEDHALWAQTSRAAIKVITSRGYLASRGRMGALQKGPAPGGKMGKTISAFTQKKKTSRPRGLKGSQ